MLGIAVTFEGESYTWDGERWYGPDHLAAPKVVAVELDKLRAGGQSANGACAVCRINPATDTTTEDGQSVPICLACLDKKYPVRGKPPQEGTYAAGGGGSTNPYARD